MWCNRRVVVSLLVAVAIVVSFVPFAGPLQVAQAVSTTVVISQVYGGGGNTGATYKNDFIELYNRGATTVDVTGWSVQYAATAGVNWQKTDLAGTIEPGKYYLIQEAAGAGGTTNLPTPNAIGSIAMGAAAGKVALVSNNVLIAAGTSCPTANVVDFVGFGSATNCSETSPTANLSNTTAALRKSNGAQDTDNNNADFTIGTPNPRNTPPPDAAPAVADTVPANGASNVPYDTNVSVTFTEPVNVTSAWYTLSCSLSGTHTAAVSGGPTIFTVNPDSNFISGDTCTFVVLAGQVSDQDNNDPPDNMVANFTVGFSTVDACTLSFTPIYDIQGSGATVALPGSQTTQGVVVGDYEGPSPALRGFFIQDPVGDGDPATSDGIFVFEGSNADAVSLGDIVRVTGTAGENQGQSQISVGTIVKCGTGTVTPTDVTFPVSSADFLKQYEGMLVRLPQTMYVTEHFQLGRFGQVVLSSGGKLKQPTNIYQPGPLADAQQTANNLNKIILDDASQTQNPDPILFARGGLPLSASNTLRGGDTATNIVGVLNYTWAGNAASGNAYRVRPINALNGYVNFVEANSRPTSAPSVGGTVRVVGMNLLNFFNTFSGCTNGVGGAATDCRGATSQSEFDRQWPKTVAAISAMNPDVFGVNELENNGYGSASALQFLVDKLNAATAPGTYAFIDVDANTGQVNAMGTDAIRVAMLYKPAVVTPVGQTSPLNSVAFVNGGDGAPRSRPSLAQAFQVNATGAVFIVDLNHLKSKGSACDAPDAGDGQGNCNQVRVNAATELMNWFATNPTGTGDPDILMLGDYNSYAKEDPISVIKSAGFTNLIESFVGPDAYSYVFDGQWGYLDHALGSASLVPQVKGVADYHINSDEPSVLDYLEDFKSAGQLVSLYAPDQFRISDHDPVVVGLTPNAPPTVDAGGPYSVNEGGSVTLTATGSDPNGDSLTYAWDLDNNGSFETNGQSVSFDASLLDGPSSYTVKVEATDPLGLSAESTATVNVVNVAPTVAASFGSSSVSCGPNNSTLNVSFTDPGAADTHTAVINWGDGNTQTVSPATSPFALQHTYALAGNYTATVTVTDDDGGTGNATASVTVKFNTSGFLQPINVDGTSVFKYNSTIPVKIQLHELRRVNPCEPCSYHQTDHDLWGNAGSANQ